MEKDILIDMCVQKEETFFFPFSLQKVQVDKIQVPPPLFSKQILTTSSFFTFSTNFGAKIYTGCRYH